MRRISMGAGLSLLVVGAAVAAPTANFSGNPAAPALKASLDAQFIQAMQLLNVPGMATVVVRDGSVRWLQTYGVLDSSKSETLASNKVAPTTPFRVASVSKAMTATITLRMAESSTGYLFSSYVDDYLPSTFPLVNPAYPSARVTLTQLLTHTSSIADARPVDFAPPSISDSTLASLLADAASNTLTYTDPRIATWVGTASTATTVGSGETAYYVISNPASDGPLSLEQYLRRALIPGGADYPIPSFSPNRSYYAAVPGTFYKYNNVNTTLLGYVLERAYALKGTSKTFPEIASEQVFQPLGMTSASFSINSTSAADLAATAVPHDVGGASGTVPKLKTIVNFICSRVSGCVPPYSPAETTTTVYEPLPQYGGAERPAKALRASIADLAVWVSMLASRGSVNGTQFLAQSTIDAMTTNQLAPGIHPDGTGTGLGLFRLAYGAQPVVPNDEVWGHEGGDAGVSACMMFSKSTRYGMVVVVNGPTAGQVCAMAQDLYRAVYTAENP